MEGGGWVYIAMLSIRTFSSGMTGLCRKQRLRIGDRVNQTMRLKNVLNTTIMESGMTNHAMPWGARRAKKVDTV